ncbi:MAG: winged helix-turn-helix domain-containing protein [Myxococcota bacterium]
MRIVLDDYEIDSVALRLRHAGRPIALQRRPLELLLHLVRHRDRVVSREELLATLWPGAAVSEGALSTAVYAARRALDDQERNPPWIRTVRGRGFRFEGPCEEEINTPSRSPVSAGDALPLVERGTEWSALRRAAREAAEGAGCAVFVTAAAGMGKTRLVRRFLDGLSGFRQLETIAERDFDDSPLALWSDLLRAWSGAATDLPDDTPLAEVQRRARDLIRAADAGSPLVVVLEDLHWAHPAALSVLATLIPRLARAHVLLIATYRPVGDDLAASRLMQLSLQPGVRTLPLAPLSYAGVYETLGAIRRRPASQDEISDVLRRSEGIPLYVVRLAHEPPSSGRADGSGLLADALLRLSVETRRLLGVAALVGSAFGAERVVEVADSATPTDRTWLEEALAAGLIERDRDKRDLYRFTHNLLREAAANGLEEETRIAVHARLALALEEAFDAPTPDQARRIARHCAACAEDPAMLERAVHWDLRVARSAAARFAWEDVDEATDRLLTWLARMEPGAAAHAELAEVLWLRGSAQSALPDALEGLRDSVARLEALPPVEEHEECARRLALGLLCAHFAGETPPSDRFREALRAIDSRRVRHLADALSILTDVQSGRYRAAFEGSKAILADVGPPTRDLFAGYEAADVCMAYGGIAAAMLGDDDAARTLLAAAEERARRRGDAVTQSMVIFTTCVVLDLIEDWKGLAVAAARLDPLGLEGDVRRFLGAGFSFELLARARRGEPTDLMPGVAEVVRSRAAHSEGTSFRPYLLSLAADLFGLAGEREKTLAAYREAGACAHAGEIGFAPLLLVREASWHLAWGSRDLARRRLVEACERSAATGARGALKRAQSLLAEIPGGGDALS